MNAEERDPLLVAINRMYSELDPPPAGLTERVLEKLLERPNRYHITSEMQDNIPLATTNRGSVHMQT